MEQVAPPWAPCWWNLGLLNCIMECFIGSFYTNALVVMQWSVTMETGYSVLQVAPLWAPWRWNLKLLNWIIEHSPWRFYIDALLMVRWSVTMETCLIPVRQVAPP